MFKKPLLNCSPGVPLACLLLGGSLLSGCSVSGTNTLAEATLAETALPETSSAAPTELAFETPVKLMADGKEIQLPAPGWAYPVMQDITGDGRDDLVVGQYKDGKMAVYAQQNDGSFTWHDWLQAGGEDAVVPGIW